MDGRSERRAGRTLCLGEVLVDLICEQPVGEFADAPAFSPHFGGATANVAVSAARHGAAVGLAGAVGKDPWGHWLTEKLGAEGVDLGWLATVEGLVTPMACITVDADGEPTFMIYGEAVSRGMKVVGRDIGHAVASFDALFIGSNTLTGADERAVTERALGEARHHGKPVVIDANVRPERWPSPAAAASVIRECIPGARLLRTNRREAELLSGESDPAQAAEALLHLGADAIVVTLGADGAVLAGPDLHFEPGVPSTVRSTIGAGDAFTGVLLAALAASSYDPSALRPALREAVAAGAMATESWGAVGHPGGSGKVPHSSSSEG